jgi:hypothetical protein
MATLVPETFGWAFRDRHAETIRDLPQGALDLRDQHVSGLHLIVPLPGTDAFHQQAHVIE